MSIGQCFTIQKEIAFEAGHRLMNYEGKCKFFHGHNYKMRLGLISDKVNKQGFVQDFGFVKSVVKEFIDTNVDHGMILNINDKNWIEIFQKNDQKIYLTEANPTAEVMAKHFYDLFKTSFPNLAYVEIEETPTSVARYIGPIK